MARKKNPNRFSGERRKSEEVAQLMRDINAVEATVDDNFITIFEIIDWSDWPDEYFYSPGVSYYGNDGVRFSTAVYGTGYLSMLPRAFIGPFRHTFTMRLKGFGDGLIILIEFLLPGVFIKQIIYEIDTLSAGYNDPPYLDHVAVWLNEAPLNPIASRYHATAVMTQALTAPTYLEDNLSRDVTVSYDNQILSMSIEGTSPAIPDVDITSFIDFSSSVNVSFGIIGPYNSVYSTHEQWIEAFKHEEKLNTGIEQTEWYRYFTDQTRTSLGTPDGGASVPDLNYLGREIPEADRGSGVCTQFLSLRIITDMRAAIESIAKSGRVVNPNTGAAFNWDSDSENNLYNVGMQKYLSSYGVTDGSQRYDWVVKDIGNRKTYDLDIGEVHHLVRTLQTAL